MERLAVALAQTRGCSVRHVFSTIAAGIARAAAGLPDPDTWEWPDDADVWREIDPEGM